MISKSRGFFAFLVRELECLRIFLNQNSDLGFSSIS